MSERKDHFINESIDTDRSRDGRQLCIRWHSRDKILRVETTQFILANPASHYRDVIYISIINHRRERGFYITSDKLISSVFFPDCVQSHNCCVLVPFKPFVVCLASFLSDR